MIVNLIADSIAEIIIYLLGFIICLLVTGWVLPKIFIRPDYRGMASCDRGLKKYAYEDGRAIVYEPTAESKKYVDQYIVSMNSGEKFLKCKVDPRVFSLEYDVVAFNSRDKVLDVLTVTDLIVGKRELSTAVSLPTDTAYISLIVKRVNGVKVCKKPIVYYSAVKLAAYVAICAAINAAQVLVVKSFIEELIVAYSSEIAIISDFKTFLAAAVISAVCSLFVILAHCIGHIKVKNDSKIIGLVKKIFEKMRGVRHGKRSTANFKRFLSIFASR